MLCVWWNFKGVIHWEFVPNGHAGDAALYSQQLERVHEIWRRRYPALVNRNSSLAAWQCETSYCTNNHDKIQELGGIELLPQPPHSPDLAPSDYHLFRSMAHFLGGRNFENIEAVEVGLTEFFPSKTRGWYRLGIMNFAEGLLKSMNLMLSTLKSSLMFL